MRPFLVDHIRAGRKVKLSEHIRRTYRRKNPNHTGTYYMVSDRGHAVITFTDTNTIEAAEFVRGMESQGYWWCFKLRWRWRQWMESLKCWRLNRARSRASIRSKSGVQATIEDRTNDRVRNLAHRAKPPAQ